MTGVAAAQSVSTPVEERPATARSAVVLHLKAGINMDAREPDLLPYLHPVIDGAIGAAAGVSATKSFNRVVGIQAEALLISLL